MAPARRLRTYLTRDEVARLLRATHLHTSIAPSGQAVATVQAKNGRDISRTTSPDTGSATPSPPRKSSSMSRNLSSLAIIFGGAAMML